MPDEFLGPLFDDLGFYQRVKGSHGAAKQMAGTLQVVLRMKEGTRTFPLVVKSNLLKIHASVSAFHSQLKLPCADFLYKTRTAFISAPLTAFCHCRPE